MKTEQAISGTSATTYKVMEAPLRVTRFNENSMNFKHDTKRYSTFFRQSPLGAWAKLAPWAPSFWPPELPE